MKKQFILLICVLSGYIGYAQQCLSYLLIQLKQLILTKKN